MRTRTFLAGAVLVLFFGIGLIVLDLESPSQPEFAFEGYERFWGFGRSDDDLARADFQKIFPIGKPIEAFREFFEGIGGRCFELPIDRPGQLICIYQRPVNFVQRILPLRNSWSAHISYDPETKLSTGLNLFSGMDGL